MKLYIILFNIFYNLSILFGFLGCILMMSEHFYFLNLRKTLGGRYFPTFVYDLIIFIVNCRINIKKELKNK